MPTHATSHPNRKFLRYLQAGVVALAFLGLAPTIASAAGVLNGQLWYPVGGNSADTSVGHVNSDASNPTLLLPTLPEAQGSIGIDLPAGYYFSVSTDHLFIEAHRISDNVKVDEVQIANDLNNGSPTDDDLINALVVDPINKIIYVGLWGQDLAHTGIVKVTYTAATGALNHNAAYGTGGVYDADTPYLITSTAGKLTSSEPLGSSATSRWATPWSVWPRSTIT